ncbi:hypothetical protein BU26DRAFT_584858 [Trematosphaeria pertusa]|uniref:Uncharacterized protein n=1 Tax=Trematosphaeria pertusa TaxID=390896 RepID=A0A6A6HW49_9PLEO|nr:uncharacterized protein BU26DRAFT_584858 [Trematosphaeria pertusa]KAF2241988.1 hypothetical protein BU26DRAFT_584858 [Trematosphaeria pertusa]
MSTATGHNGSGGVVEKHDASLLLVYIESFRRALRRAMLSKALFCGLRLPETRRSPPAGAFGQCQNEPCRAASPLLSPIADRHASHCAAAHALQSPRRLPFQHFERLLEMHGADRCSLTETLAADQSQIFPKRKRRGRELVTPARRCASGSSGALTTFLCDLLAPTTPQ